MKRIPDPYWYLASPYSKYPGGLEAAYKIALDAATLLLKHDVPVFSPIIYTHSLARHGGFDPLDHDIWMWLDQPFMEAAQGLIVLCAQGWQDSYGIGVELRYFRSIARKPVVWMAEGFVPSRFCK